MVQVVQASGSSAQAHQLLEVHRRTWRGAARLNSLERASFQNEGADCPKGILFRVVQVTERC